jgi:hypothetical protein
MRVLYYSENKLKSRSFWGWYWFSLVLDYLIHRGFSPVSGTGLCLCGTVLTVSPIATRAAVETLLGPEEPLIHRAEAAV